VARGDHSSNHSERALERRKKCLGKKAWDLDLVKKKGFQKRSQWVRKRQKEHQRTQLVKNKATANEVSMYERLRGGPGYSKGGYKSEGKSCLKSVAKLGWGWFHSDHDRGGRSEKDGQGENYKIRGKGETRS